MRAALVAILTVLLAGIGVWSTMGQPMDPPKKPAPSPPTKEPTKPSSERDLTRLSVSQRHCYLSAQRGVDWLQRANRPDGHFVYGYLPSLRSPMEGDNYLHQIGAAFTLARAARFFRDEKAAVLATHALLALLAETTTDPKESQVRYSALPPAVVNRIAAAGLLLMAIHELPQPRSDFLEQADQLCNYLRKQQRADGSFKMAESDDGKADVASHHHAGPALFGLLRSCQHRSGPWKLDAVRRGCTYYHARWREQKSLAFLPWLSGACTEVYLQTKDPAFATAVFEVNDWLCTLQYSQLNPRRPLWIGGFTGWADGKTTSEAPQVNSALPAQSLADACRVARQAGDVQRHQRYTDALEKSLQFLTTLQYTEASTQHFADWYRPLLVGAFHRSHQDGDLRLDYTQHAVCALVQYLQHVAELP